LALCSKKVVATHSFALFVKSILTRIKL
jgi:hypothetical protein